MDGFGCIDIYLKLFLSHSFLSVSVADFQTGKPTIDGQVANVTVLEGKTAILECYIHALGDYKVGWLRNETRLLNDAEKMITDDIRFSIERPKVGQWNLHIRNVTYSDHGTYTCRVNTDPLISKYVNLNVAVPAKIRNEVSSNDTVVKEGETLILTCKASGIPEPEMKWSKGFNILTYIVKGDTMKIENITRQDGGTYICNAYNKYTYASREVKVTVVFAPEITMSPKEIGQTTGGKIFLECRILAVPTPRIYWRKDNVSLESVNDDMYKVVQFSGTLSLTMSNLQQEQFGVYTCVAENTVGSNSESVHLYAVNTSVQTDQSDSTNSSSNTSSAAAPEVITFAKRIGQYLGGEVILECVISGATHEDMYWLKDNVTLEFFADEYFNEYTLDYAATEEYMRLKIANVRKSQFGEYKCYAENSFGKSFETVILYEVKSDQQSNIVTTTEIATSTEESGEAPKVSLLAKVIGQLKGHDVILECIIVASPYSNMYWMKDGERLASLDNNSYKEEIFPDGHVTKLRLRLLSLRDCQFGRYSCYAGNTFGEDSDTVIVYDYSKGLPLEEINQKSNVLEESVSGFAAKVLHTFCVVIVVLLTGSLFRSLT